MNMFKHIETKILRIKFENMLKFWVGTVQIYLPQVLVGDSQVLNLSQCSTPQPFMPWCKQKYIYFTYNFFMRQEIKNEEEKFKREVAFYVGCAYY